MDQSHIIKRIQKLVKLVIELQKDAPEGISYNIEWSGRTNRLSFFKFRAGGLDTEITNDIYCYPGESLGELPFEEFEKQIKNEKEKIKNA